MYSRMSLAATIALYAVSVCASLAVAASTVDLSLPAVPQGVNVVHIDVSVNAAQRAQLLALYDGEVVDVVHVSSGDNLESLDVSRCYVEGEQPASLLLLQLQSYEGAAVDFSLTADKTTANKIHAVHSSSVQVSELTNNSDERAPRGEEVQEPIKGVFLEASPSPFNPSVNISFGAKSGDFAVVSAYDIRGQLVKKLYSGLVRSELTSLSWHGRDDQGRALPSGVYMLRMNVGGEVATKKVILAK